LDLSESQIVKFAEIPKLASLPGSSNKLDLTSVTVSEVKDFSFLRQPKPKQEAPKEYHEASIRKLADQKSLAQFIEDKCNKGAQIVSLTEQMQEKPIDSDLINIFETLTTGELIQYWDLENL
jgi:hypothetical protein